ncbi:MAG: anthranilate synthase component I family protein [Clostridiales bacterium]|nr:anthranilate synthase component I family protein [Clostridiales bacterium]
MIKPTLKEAEQLAKGYTLLPITMDLFSDARTPVEALRAVSGAGGRAFLLESAPDGDSWGRYSFLGFDPELTVSGRGRRVTVRAGGGGLGGEGRDRCDEGGLGAGGCGEDGKDGDDGLGGEGRDVRNGRGEGAEGAGGRGEDGKGGDDGLGGEGRGRARELEGDPHAILKELIGGYSSPRMHGAPPFTGGFVGYFAYEYIRHAEPALKLKLTERDDIGFDDFELMLFKKVVVFDHFAQRMSLVVNIETDNLAQNYAEGVAALKDMERAVLGRPAERGGGAAGEGSDSGAGAGCRIGLDGSGVDGGAAGGGSGNGIGGSGADASGNGIGGNGGVGGNGIGSGGIGNWVGGNGASDNVLGRPTKHGGGAAGEGVGAGAGLASAPSKEAFCAAVEKIKRRIADGDIFQCVPSVRFRAEYRGDLLQAYRVLRTSNPSAYMFYLRLGDMQLAGASPETLVALRDGAVHTCPIAGTCRRGRDDAETALAVAELLRDEKELAEHDMLVDLGRNDIGKVARFGTVRVDEYRTVKKLSRVCHIASRVSGLAREGVVALDVVRAMIPAGTLSGAPKIRACEIIDEIEGARRGPYGGAIGYIGFAGDMDLCIGIRMAALKGGAAYVQAGAGIVADSVPEREYEECLNKAGAMLDALRKAARAGETGEGALE